MNYCNAVIKSQIITHKENRKSPFNFMVPLMTSHQINHKCLELFNNIHSHQNKWWTFLTYKSLFVVSSYACTLSFLCTQSHFYTHFALHDPFCWVTLCLLLLVFVSCYPFIALHAVDFFYLNAFALSRIMIGHKGMMPLHAWRRQWRGWQTSWIEFMCLISFLLQLSLLYFALDFFSPSLPAYFVTSHTRRGFSFVFFVFLQYASHM